MSLVPLPDVNTFVWSVWGLAIVNVSASGLAPEWPAVISDSESVATLAADHLASRGLRRFGYCGDIRFKWSENHGRSFVRRLGDLGHACSIFESRKGDSLDWDLERRRMGEWIERLPKPCGIMACYDIRGQQVLDVCRQLGLRTPEC